jgi:hypothetical protein
MIRRLASFACTLTLVACAGRGMAPNAGPNPTVAASPTPPSAGGSLVRESFTFLPPPPSSTNAAHHPLYVTADIASVQITLDSVNGSAPSTNAPLSVTTNLTITTCPCTVYGPSVPPGSDTFTLTAYDEPNASGNLIATATPTYTIAAGQANNENVTLNGVPARFSLSFSGKAPDAGASTTTTLSVTVFDGDGNTIMGTYANAVTLADSDTSGATSIATSGSDNPPANGLLSSNDSAMLTYTGLAIPPATITATAKSATGSGSYAPALQPITVTTSDVQNPNYIGVDLYATSGAGSTATFSASEVGWTNAPYNQSFTATANGCSSVATVAPASGTSFTATVVGAPTAGTCTLTLADGSGQTQSVTLAYTQFTYTGGAQSIIVPAGVASVAIAAYGAQGAANAAAGGDGGEAQGTFTVAVGQTLYVFAGGEGSGVGSGSGGGYNGGGAGVFGGGGGGASDVRFVNNLIASRAIVGGGGGGGGFDTGTTGGNGGGTSGSAGGNGTGGGFGGGGGTQTAGGGASFFAQPGGIAYGGYADNTSDGGGGGGGYYGGGGGSTTGGGGGGSSYVDGAATSASTTSGVQSGNGLVILIW